MMYSYYAFILSEIFYSNVLIGILLKIHRRSFQMKQFLSLAEWVFYAKASSQSREQTFLCHLKINEDCVAATVLEVCALLWGLLLHDKTPPLEKLIPLSRPESVFRPSVTRSVVQRVMRMQGRFWWRSLQPTFH